MSWPLVCYVVPPLALSTGLLVALGTVAAPLLAGGVAAVREGAGITGPISPENLAAEQARLEASAPDVRVTAFWSGGTQIYRTRTGETGLVPVMYGTSLGYEGARDGVFVTPGFARRISGERLSVGGRWLTVRDVLPSYFDLRSFASGREMAAGVWITADTPAHLFTPNRFLLRRQPHRASACSSVALECRPLVSVAAATAVALLPMAAAIGALWLLSAVTVWNRLPPTTRASGRMTMAALCAGLAWVVAVMTTPVLRASVHVASSADLVERLAMLASAVVLVFGVFSRRLVAWAWCRRGNAAHDVVRRLVDSLPFATLGLSLVCLAALFAMSPTDLPADAKQWSARVTFGTDRYPTRESRFLFVQRLLALLDERGLGAVAAVAQPLHTSVDDRVSASFLSHQVHRDMDLLYVSQRFFDATGTSLIAGGLMGDIGCEAVERPVVATIVSGREAQAPTYVNERVRIGTDAGAHRIVGVAAYHTPALFLPLCESALYQFTLIARDGRPWLQTASALDDAIHDLDPSQPLDHRGRSGSLQSRAASIRLWLTTSVLTGLPLVATFVERRRVI